MKKLLVLMAAAFGMIACQTGLNEVNVASGEVDVTFEVGTPVARAYSDGTTATKLQYAVYDANGQLTALTKTDATINGSAKVELKLVTGNTYTVLFWAAAEDAPYNVTFAQALDEAVVTVDYNGSVSNAENRDAFFKCHTFTVKGAQTESIELKRPFAQLNIGTADYVAAKNAGYVPTQSSVKVKNVYSTLNLATGDVEDDVVAEFALADIKKDETFPVAGNEYLAMNYLLVNGKETVDVEFTYTNGTDAKTRTVGSVPVQRNHRTNIYGSLLTSEVDINVEIKQNYEGEKNQEVDFNTTVDPASLQIGDIVEINGAIGVVFQVGDIVKMVSVEEGEDLPWSTAEWTTTGANDVDNGKNNMVKIQEISNWEHYYLAFKWCADYGNGWYLPAQNELIEIYNQREAINATLESYGHKVLELYRDANYWSSSETNNVMSKVVDFIYEESDDNITGGGCWYNEIKSRTRRVRAIVAL